MSRIAEYVKTLTPDERERFADLIREHEAQERLIADSAAGAAASLRRVNSSRRELVQGVHELAEMTVRLRETIGRLYLLLVPAQGRVS